MSMNWIWCPNHNLQHIACEKPSESPTALLPPWGETKRWGGICMATNNSRRCWNTLYMYEADLLWVWFGWVASIITYNMIHLMLVNVEAEAYQVLPSPPLTLRDLIFSVGSIYLATQFIQCMSNFLYKLDMEWMWYSGWDGISTTYGLSYTRTWTQPP